MIEVRDNASSLWQNIHAWFIQQLNDQKPKGTIASLDGVRALAFLLVFNLHANHAGVWGDWHNQIVSSLFSLGRTGVTLFFVLSGFLLFLPYIQALLFEKEWPRSKIYYIRRILRIFPGYFFSLFILIMFTQPSFLQPHNWKQLAHFLTFTMGYTLSGTLNGPYWTLAVEFQYYLLLPLIAFAILGLTRLVRPEKRLWVVVGSLFAMIVWGLLTARYGPYYISHPDKTILVPRSIFNVIIFIAYGDHGKFFEDFAVGMLIGVGYLSIMKSPRKDYYLQKMQQVFLLLLIFVLALFIYMALPSYTLPVIPVEFQIRKLPWTNEFAFALCYGYLVFVVLLNPPTGWLTRLFSWTPLRWLGLISYSLYIWHRPLTLVLAGSIGKYFQRLHPILTITLFSLTAFTVIVVFCFFLFVTIEKPGMRLSERLRRQILQREAEKQDITQKMPVLPKEPQPSDVVPVRS